MKKYLWVQDRFHKGADQLRSYYEKRFLDPRQARSDRFVWDFWHVPDQYTLVRTPAQSFFPQSLLRPLLEELSHWGRNTLGCAALSPPWLSYYVEGCEQKLHSDVPHGPWAYVYSLSPKQLSFLGGETLLLRPEVLDYWKNFSDSQDRELTSFVERVAPKFNRLVVFDPRLPHGVTPVKGTLDPRQARLVVHGWFTDPKPCLRGPLKATQVAPVLDEAVGRFSEVLSQMGQWHGILSLQIAVKPGGTALEPRVLADTLVPIAAPAGLERRLRTLVVRSFAGLQFPRAKGPTTITLPLLFR